MGKDRKIERISYNSQSLILVLIIWPGVYHVLQGSPLKY
jgi:hypothetical protein